MRLLNTERVELELFIDEILLYAILSHTWEQEEVMFQDMEQGQAKDKKGYAKINNCCSIARDNGYKYIWIDTCCIDKASSAELTEAINSMYRYYQEAEVCYSFLSDISWPSDFTQSRWFTRGWTLQELIAPTSMVFFNKDWQHLGTKASLGRQISEHTGVPQAILSGAENLESASIAQRMSWAADRKTTRLEDRAYSLMGIFDINMPLLYGEGHKAFIRLQEEILRVSDDHSIFAWRHTDTRSGGGFLAETPDAFKASKNIISWNPFTPYNSPFTVTNKGVHLDAPFIAQTQGGLGLVVLHCAESGSRDQLVGVYLRDPFLTMEHFERCRPEEFTLVNLRQFSPSQYPTRNLCIGLRGKAPSQMQGSAVSKGQEPQTRQSTEGADNAENDEQEKDHQRRLLFAASVGNEAAVKELLNLSNIDADSTNEENRTPVSLAAEAGHERIVDLLLTRREVDINSKDIYGFTPLSYAASEGHEKVVWILLARSDIVPSSQDARKRTFVSLAARRGHKSLVGQLLARKDTQRHLIDGTGRSVLSHAAETGQEEVARLILGSGKVHPDLRDQAGRSALWYASKNGRAGLVKLLLETGWVDPTSKDNDGSTAVWQAASNGHCPAVKWLLAHHADFEIKGELGRTPLCQASANGHTDVVKELLNSNADAEAKDKDRATAIWHAATRGYEVIVEMLLESGADPDGRGIDDQTGLWHAASKGYHVIVQLLLENHATSLNKHGKLLGLDQAAESGHDAVIKVFLKKCHRDHRWDDHLGTAISSALSNNQEVDVETMIKSLENVGAVHRTTRAYWLLNSVLLGKNAIVRLLLDNGVDVNVIFDGTRTLWQAAQHGCLAITNLMVGTLWGDRMIKAWHNEMKRGRSGLELKNKATNMMAEDYSPNVLWCAVVGGDETLVEALLQYGADTEVKITEGKTVLFYAVSLGLASLVRLLIEHGANVEALDDNDQSPWISAASEFAAQRNRIPELLLDHGADIEEKDEDGQTLLMQGSLQSESGATPLMIAARFKGKVEIVRLLLEHGADLNAKDERGRTAASRAEDEAVLSLLRYIE
ncbi:hypothetical protein CEP54_006582 [Fusarium duplospermum]|uniref:Uncharacterized protein n=1 Tax=Fusarium duplospermum TaxID=1325734 RepID=A0A428Q648_9HYPO|nr:hypothetical protein CEP54_006582 [Fusarium duplospermum]